MCSCAAHYFTKCAVIQGLKFFWGRGIETRKLGLHGWENSTGVSQLRKERCARRLTSGKAVDWDGRAGPGARADGGSAAGAELGAPQRVQEVPRAQQQVLERGACPAREHHETPPPLVLLQLPPLVLNLLPLLLLSLLLLVLVLLLLVLLLQAALRHAPRVSLKKTNSHYHHTSTTSTTSKETLTYISQLGSLLLWGRAPFLPPPPPSSFPSSLARSH